MPVQMPIQATSPVAYCTSGTSRVAGSCIVVVVESSRTLAHWCFVLRVLMHVERGLDEAGRGGDRGSEEKREHAGTHKLESPQLETRAGDGDEVGLKADGNKAAEERGRMEIQTEKARREERRSQAPTENSVKDTERE